MTVPGLLLAACALGPDFVAPAAPAVDGYTPERRLPSTAGAPTAGGNSQAFAPGSDLPGVWWALFHSKQINAFVEEAVRNHPDVQAAESPCARPGRARSRRRARCFHRSA